MTQSIDRMRERITDEIFLALGLKRDGFLRRRFGRLFYRPTRRFSEMFARADEAAGLGGLPAGGRSILADLSIQVQARGGEHIPEDGPLVVVSNHPGAYDSVALAACIPRPDLKIIAYETQFYHALPQIRRRMILAPGDPPGRMLALRQAIQYLQEGGAILQFGSGRIEPDPAVASGAEEWFENWSPSLEVMLRKTPETRLVLAIASGVLLRRFANHPFTRLRPGAINRRRLAEFTQVIYHLMRPAALRIDVRLSFSPPVYLADLEREAEGRRLMPAILGRARRLLAEHQDHFHPARV
jgi:hypothetical protein